MLEDRRLELIHAEIDRTLSSQERAELNGYLLADPALRRERDGLVKACNLLDGLEAEEPPADFTIRILGKLESAGSLPVRSRKPLFLQQPLTRYAAAFGAGLAVAAIAFGGAGRTGEHEFQQLAGTMAASSTTGVVSPAGMRIAAEQLRGEARIRRSESGDLTLLEFELQATAPLEVVAEFNGQTARFRHPDGKAGHFGMVLGVPADEVSVRFVVAGEVVHQGVLHAAGNG